ncbi:hypothetical protein MMC07_006669 [Pseudocyphellaria aurata]|nr:hypothetical protein [Pseudocyphellaria aurata]
MRLTVLFLCIASLTFALALPAWKQVTKPPRSLSSSLRLGASEVLNFGKQALLHGGARLSRRNDEDLDLICEDSFGVVMTGSFQYCSPGSGNPSDPVEGVKKWWQDLATYWGFTSKVDKSRSTVVSPEKQSNFNVYTPPPSREVSFPGNSPT